MTRLFSYYDHWLLAGIITLLQWHGILFWYSSTGPSGALWSLLLECAALWLWYNRINSLAALCSLLIILGPLYHIAGPTITALETGKINEKIMQSYELESSIDAKAAQGSTGNITRLRAVENARKDAKASLEKYRASLVVSTPGWFEYAKLGVQALGLVFLQLAQILIIRRFRPVPAVKRIIQAVAAGKFNDKPGLVAIQDALGVTREQVRDAFHWLVKHGYMEVNDKKISLVKQANLEYSDIIL